ncbi:MAG: hypothetical protein QOF96_3850 [Actinomycetota bacterium]|nr:hypothetical protein [Actinomycetota bacterium]
MPQESIAWLWGSWTSFRTASSIRRRSDKLALEGRQSFISTADEFSYTETARARARQQREYGFWDGDTGGERAGPH